MIEEKITISFDYQDFTFAQQVNDENEILMDVEDKDGAVITIYFTTEEQIQKVIDNLYEQKSILKNAKQQSNTKSKT